MKTTFGALGANASFTILTGDSGLHYLYTKLDLTDADKVNRKPNSIRERHQEQCTVSDNTEVLELL